LQELICSWDCIAGRVPPNFLWRAGRHCRRDSNFRGDRRAQLIFDCRGQSISESIERLQWFATDVIPLADG
jgi:hypothetical protein